jgi:glycosyltransferase involved in cell wall biosynthesis
MKLRESPIKLSACIIAKNEEELLPQCLESIKVLCDEVILVDTGSSDSTVSIAESFGAKVYHHSWQDDFSLHRNQSIGYAKDADFILVIDCDEKIVIDPKLTKKGIVEWFEKAPEDVNAIALMVQDIQHGKMMMCCNSARIFRKGKIRYEGAVHNQPIFTGPCGLCHFMVLEHYGYGLSEDKMEVKFIRTRDLLLDRYKKSKKDYQVAFYLCQLYGQHGDTSDSIEWGEEYIENKDKMGNHFNTSIYFTMVRNYQTQEDWKKTYEVLRMGLRDDPINPDLGLALSDQGTFTHEPHIVAEGARRFLKGYKKCMEEPNTMEGKFYFTLRADAMALMIYRLCISCFQEGMDAWSLFQDNKQHADPMMMEEFKENLGSLGMVHLRDELFGKEGYPLAKLSAKSRKKLPKSDFAIPEERKYPVTDKAHAANAMARVAANGTVEEKRRVKNKVKQKYPDLPSVSEDGKKKKKKKKSAVK